MFIEQVRWPKKRQRRFYVRRSS